MYRFTDSRDSVGHTSAHLRHRLAARERRRPLIRPLRLRGHHRPWPARARPDRPAPRIVGPVPLDADSVNRRSLASSELASQPSARERELAHDRVARHPEMFGDLLLRPVLLAESEHRDALPRAPALLRVAAARMVDEHAAHHARGRRQVVEPARRGSRGGPDYMDVWWMQRGHAALLNALERHEEALAIMEPPRSRPRRRVQETEFQCAAK